MQLGQLYSAYTRKKDVPILFFFNLPGFKGSNRLWINFADWKFWKYFELKNKLQTILLIAKLQGNCEWIFTFSCGKLFYGMVICFILLVSFFILPFLNQNAKISIKRLVRSQRYPILNRSARFVWEIIPSRLLKAW